MKYYRYSIGLLLLMAAACSVEEADFEPFDRTVENRPVYHAVIDDETSTKTFVDADLNVLWNKGDRFTIFPNNTLGNEYEFIDDDGSSSGDLEPIEAENDGVFHIGTELDGHDYAIYPHSKDTKIVSNGTITYTFPDVQTYQEKSFGRGANVMVARTTHGNLNLGFKNVLGYLSFRFYGTNVHVSSIILEAMGNERISGTGTIVSGEDGPVVTMGESASNIIRLYCDDVLLGTGTSETDYTEFWFALPPVAFTKAKGGFKITVTTTDGGVFEKQAAIDLTIKRKTVERMNPLKVEPNYETAYNMAINKITAPRNDRTENDTYDAVESDGTFTLTIPTITDFSNVVINFTLKNSSDVLMVGGKEVKSGDSIDATQKPTSLVVRRGKIEKTFKLLVKNTGLPVVKITTTGEGFTLDKLESYKNKLNSSDKKDHRIWLPVEADDEENSSEYHADWSASVSIYNPDGSAGMVGTTVETQIKGRGNYTWKWLKKPYALKFKQEKEVLGMPAHNRWILLANWRDRTLLRNDATFELSRRFGLPYTVRGQFVELEFNGEHRGNYYLCEQIKIDKNRVNIKKLKKDFDKETVDYSGGYLMEIDSYFDEANRFRSDYFDLKYMFKEPDNVPTDDDWDPRYQTGYTWMRNYINNLEKVLKTKSSVYNGDSDHNGDFNDLLDVDSAILFMLLNELSGNRDYFQDGDDDHYGPHSTYLYKDKGGKLFFGPGWDFDYETYIAQSYINGSGTKDGWRGFTQTGYYYHFMRYNPNFVERIKTLWNDRKSTIQGLPTYISQKFGEIELSQTFDQEIWPYNPRISSTTENRNDNHDYYENHKVVPFSTAISRMIEYFNDRVTWIDDRINGNKNKGIAPLSTTNPTFLYEDSSKWPQ